MNFTKIGMISVIGLSSLFSLGSVSFADDIETFADLPTSSIDLRNRSEAVSKGVIEFNTSDVGLVDPDEPNVIDPINPDNPPLKPDDGNGSTGDGRTDFYINWASTLAFKNIDMNKKVMTQFAEPIVLFRPDKPGGVARDQEVSPFIEVTDNRKNGKGWMLSVTAEPFKSGDKVLNGSSLYIQDFVIKPAWNIRGTTGIKTEPKLLTREINFDNTSYELMSLAKNNDLGDKKDVWILAFTDSNNPYDVINLTPHKDKGIMVKVPFSYSIDKNDKYISNLTWTLSSVPS